MQIDKTEIIMIRHGQVDFPSGVFYGQMDVPLSETGKKQSLICAKHLKDQGINAVITSDLSRCLFMAKAIAETSEATLIVEPCLREIFFGKWQGMSWDEIEQKYPGQMEVRMKNLPLFRPPGGESLTDLQNRAFKVMERVFKGEFGKKIAIVAHGGVNRTILCKILGMSLQNLFCLQQDYACLNRIDAYQDGLIVARTINCTCHLLKAL